MANPLRVLIIEDSEADAAVLLRELEQGGFEPAARRVKTGADLARALEVEAWDAVVADPSAQQVSVLAALRQVREKGLDIPFLVVADAFEESLGAAVLEAGAHDYLLKGQPARLSAALKRELGARRTREERRQALEALRDSEERFRELAASLPQVFWISSPSGERVVYASPAYESKWGRQVEELYRDGRDWLQAVHPDDREAVEERSRPERWRDSEPLEQEYRVVHPDGSLRWIHERRFPIGLEGGRPRHVACLATDITHRKLQEDRDRLLSREQAARARAEEANRAKEKFLEALAHELLAPLAPLLSTAELLKKSESLATQLQHVPQVIRRSVEQELRLINDLLEMTRISGGKLALNLDRVDIHAALEKAIEPHRQEILSKGIRLTTDFAAREHQVHGDPSRLLHVFGNLLGNAVKLTPAQGGIAVTTQNQRPGVIAVQIQDTGKGIDSDVITRLFQAEGDGEQLLAFGELGLGLSISKTLVHLHGGKVAAESTGRDQGSTFTVELATLAASSPAPPVEAARRTPLTILVVENNEDTLWMLTKLLRGSGHKVLAATSAESALATAGANEFDILVCDIGLPDRSGWELMQELRARAPVRGIALSGFGSDEDARKSSEYGFSAHLTKPVQPQKLEAVIEQLAA